MAKLTAAGRNKIKSSNFALPGKRYPIEDVSHARNALSRVSQNGTPAEKAKVRAKVHAKFPSIGGPASAKQPHPETNPGFYDTEPHAPGNRIANKPLMPPPAQGANTPKMVPEATGRFDGIGGAAPHSFPKAGGGAHGYGHNAIQRAGHVRLSGHTGAHRIGHGATKK